MPGEPGYRAIGRVTHKANDAEPTVPMPARVVAGPIELDPLRIGIDQRFAFLAGTMSWRNAVRASPYRCRAD